MRIALPYYGRLVEPRQGVSRLFFIADVDLQNGSISSLNLVSIARNAAEGLSGWLKGLLVNGILSTDRPEHQLACLEANGLWHQQVSGKEPDDQIREWLRQQDLSAEVASDNSR